MHDLWNTDIILESGQYAFTSKSEMGTNLFASDEMIIDHKYDNYWEMIGDFGR